MGAGDRSDDAALADYLFGLKPRGAKLGIDRMRPLAAELDHPERKMPMVHVAGTNGKGSVAAMVDGILRAAGWRVGLYTSPHLLHPGERVQVNRIPMTHAELAAYTRELDLVADRIAAGSGQENRPSFFEYMTAMAFLQFERRECDVAVIETGLGGEFDATNIVSPEVSVITSVGLDHTEWLGETIEKIAAAKAGIIKPQVPVVIGRLPVIAERVVREMAAKRHSPVTSVREVFGEESRQYPETNLEGEYQRWNAATATLVARELGASWRMTAEAIREGLLGVAWPGRWQRINAGNRKLILDASHNPEGAEVLDVNLARLARETGRGPVVIVGVLGLDRGRPLIASICRHAREVHLVVPHQPRASSQAELVTVVPPDFRGRVICTSLEKLFPGDGTCTAGEAADVVVVTGSIYLVGEVMARIGA